MDVNWLFRAFSNNYSLKNCHIIEKQLFSYVSITPFIRYYTDIIQITLEKFIVTNILLSCVCCFTYRYIPKQKFVFLSKVKFYQGRIFYLVCHTNMVNVKENGILFSQQAKQKLQKYTLSDCQVNIIISEYGTQAVL